MLGSLFCFMGVGFFQRWLWSFRLQRVERNFARLRIGLQPLTVWDARLIEKLVPQELRDLREAQAERRYRKDALYALDLERFRLSGLLKLKEPELPAAVEAMEVPE